ncbi:hypothetical protein [Haloquadratum walsbyi]|uniref:hypothetical protein n=1 Tax=Haloquadratum walsbyi TaxID=293091 RepID=UPI0015F6AFB1|nr:hypothetical protein [Haloquadratum walsbyi]
MSADDLSERLLINTVETELRHIQYFRHILTTIWWVSISSLVTTSYDIITAVTMEIEFTLFDVSPLGLIIQLDIQT